MNTQYVIYQIKKMSETPYSFMPWKFATEHGFSFSDYKAVYSGTSDSEYCLETLFVMFNACRKVFGWHPDGFKGHSLSVSDIVALRKEGDSDWNYYYCDSFEWIEIKDLDKWGIR